MGKLFCIFLVLPFISSSFAAVKKIDANNIEFSKIFRTKVNVENSSNPKLLVQARIMQVSNVIHDNGKMHKGATSAVHSNVILKYKMSLDEIRNNDVLYGIEILHNSKKIKIDKSCRNEKIECAWRVIDGRKPCEHYHVLNQIRADIRNQDIQYTLTDNHNGTLTLGCNYSTY